MYLGGNRLPFGDELEGETRPGGDPLPSARPPAAPVEAELMLVCLPEDARKELSNAVSRVETKLGDLEDVLHDILAELKLLNS